MREGAHDQQMPDGAEDTDHKQHRPAKRVGLRPVERDRRAHRCCADHAEKINRDGRVFDAPTIGVSTR